VDAAPDSAAADSRTLTIADWRRRNPATASPATQQKGRFSAEAAGVEFSAMRPLTRDEVTAALGETDDLIVVEILRTGATPDELAEALAWLANNEPLMNIGKPLASGRVGRLVEILESAYEEEPGPMGHRV
jgi:hypothetical protein